MSSRGPGLHRSLHPGFSNTGPTRPGASTPQRPHRKEGVIVTAQALEQSVLESKDKTQLIQIAEALGVKANARNKKADIIDQILSKTGGSGAAAAAPAPAATASSARAAATPAEATDEVADEPKAEWEVELESSRGDAAQPDGGAGAVKRGAKTDADASSGSDPATSTAAKSDETKSDETKSDETSRTTDAKSDEPVGPDQVGPDQVGPDQVGPEQAGRCPTRVRWPTQRPAAAQRRRPQSEPEPQSSRRPAGWRRRRREPQQASASASQGSRRPGRPAGRRPRPARRRRGRSRAGQQRAGRDRGLPRHPRRGIRLRAGRQLSRQQERFVRARQAVAPVRAAQGRSRGRHVAPGRPQREEPGDARDPQGQRSVARRCQEAASIRRPDRLVPRLAAADGRSIRAGQHDGSHHRPRLADRQGAARHHRVAAQGRQDHHHEDDRGVDREEQSRVQADRAADRRATRRGHRHEADGEG